MWRDLKRQYKALPHNQRFSFMRGLELARAQWELSSAKASV
jgi:hypothetical protein